MRPKWRCGKCRPAERPAYGDAGKDFQNGQNGVKKRSFLNMYKNGQKWPFFKQNRNGIKNAIEKRWFFDQNGNYKIYKNSTFFNVKNGPFLIRFWPGLEHIYIIYIYMSGSNSVVKKRTFQGVKIAPRHPPKMGDLGIVGDFWHMPKITHPIQLGIGFGRERLGWPGGWGLAKWWKVPFFTTLFDTVCYMYIIYILFRSWQIWKITKSRNQEKWLISRRLRLGKANFRSAKTRKKCQNMRICAN